MKKIEIGLVALLFSMNVMAQCTSEINKEFLSIYNNPPYDIDKLETMAKTCQEAPVQMLFHLAKGDVYLLNGEVEYASKEYKQARYQYKNINDSQIEMYRGILEILEKKIERYSPKIADVVTRSLVTRSISRGADLITEYKIEDLPLNFQSNSSEIKKGVNKEQVLEIYKVLSSEKYKRKIIYIMGFTDTSGAESHNRRLSVSRANSLANYLRKKGLTNDIISEGKGESRPICSQGEIVPKKNNEYKCSIKEDKYRSRRVDITIGDR